MSEPTSFEARALLAPRRRRLARLVLLAPVIALVGITWVGVTGGRSDHATAIVPAPTLAATSGPVALATPVLVPAQVVGVPVQRLDELQVGSLGRDDVIAVAGWYVATAVTDCPPFAGITTPGSLPEAGAATDHAAFCIRSGVLYASPPDVQDSWSTGLPAVGVTVVVGVIMPPELEMVGAGATEVVVVGRLVKPGGGCLVALACPGELLIDHVAWTASA